MNVLKVLWQHLFQKTAEIPALEESVFSALKADFSDELFSGERFLELAQEIGFDELTIEEGSLRFRFDGQDVELKGDSERFALQVSEMLLEFTPPSFYDEGLQLEEPDMQGLDEHFWEKYVFDEDFAKDIPDFTEPEFHPLPQQNLPRDENPS